MVLLLLGTGMRIGEALAVEWANLELHADIPRIRAAATLVEPRRDAASGQVFVAGLRRQSMTKTGAARTVALPCAAVKMLNLAGEDACVIDPVTTPQGVARSEAEGSISIEASETSGGC